MVKVDGNIQGNQCRLELVCNTEEMVSNQYHLYHKALRKNLNKRYFHAFYLKIVIILENASMENIRSKDE